MSAPGVMLALREGTSAWHEKLERGLDLLNDARGLADYRVVLERFYGFYMPLEDRLAGAADWPGRGYDFEARRKLPLLERDLHALGASNASLAALPRCARLPGLDTWPALVGCLYVLEGSTLGGQLLSRHFDERLGLDRESGCAFFSGYGPQTGPWWQAFRAFASEQLADPGLHAGAVTAANDTFECLAHWLLAEESSPIS